MSDGESVFRSLREALLSTEFVNFRPSVVAAALLYMDRECKGKVKLWPSSLMHLTGISITDIDFQAALYAARRLNSNIYNTPLGPLDS